LTFSRETRRERAFSLQEIVAGKDIYDEREEPVGPSRSAFAHSGSPSAM
jgi:hypothetical protein